jgi:ribosome-associated protein
MIDIKNVDPRELGEKIVEVLYRKKGKAIELINVEEQTSVTEYYVIASGNSRTQIGALCDEVDVKRTEEGCPPIKVEGRGNGTWEVIDFGCVVVHIFSRESRDFYKLENLWADAEKIDVNHIFDRVDAENAAPVEN